MQHVTQVIDVWIGNGLADLQQAQSETNSRQCADAPVTARNVLVACLQQSEQE